MALTDRHFLAEHFDILFAFFGFMVQKLCNFKVQIHFLPFILIPGISTETFCTRAGLATEADRRGRATLASTSARRATGRFDQRRMPGPARRDAVTGGVPRTDPSIAHVREPGRGRIRFSTTRGG